MVIARSEGAAKPSGPRGVALELVGVDQLGIVSKLTRILAERGISIEHIQTEIVGGASAGKQTFKVAAHLLVPTSLPADELRRELEVLANEMMLDIALDGRPRSGLIGGSRTHLAPPPARAAGPIRCNLTWRKKDRGGPVTPSPPPRHVTIMTAPRHAHLAISDLLDILPDAVVMVDARSRICYVNPAVRALLGYRPDDLLNQPLTTLVPHAARARHETVVERFRRDGTPTLMGSRPVLHALHCAGRLVPVSISLCNLTLGDGERVSVAVLHDVSTLNTLLDRATATAETDLLTGLGNRLQLSRRMQALLANERSFGLLFLDLEKFKQLNDQHGHTVGDQALRIVGRRLQTKVRGADLVVRLGGDEFVMLFDDLNDAQRLHDRALSVAHSVTRPLRMDQAVGALGVNIGAAISPRHGQSEQALLQAADQAMYLAKQAGQTYRLALD